MNPDAAIRELDMILAYAQTCSMQLEEGGPLLEPKEVMFDLMAHVSGLAIILKEFISDSYEEER